MNRQVLWSRIESRLESSPLDWRERIRQLGQVEAVEQRDAGRTWSDDEVFEALLMAVLSSDTDWSNIERIQADLPDLFTGFSLASYAKLSDDEIGDRLVPWFEDRKAGSRSRKGNLLNLVGAARKLLDFSRRHGAADGYFTSLVDKCDGDPKQAALCLGQDREYKLPSLGVALAAEALKNLGFDVAKPDRHVMRAVGSFGLVRFRRWSNDGDGRNGRAAPESTRKAELLAVMTEVEQIAEAAEERVVFVDNAIWLVCARSELYLANSKLAEMAGEDESPAGQADGLAALFQSWKTEDDAGEQRETLEYLIRAMDEDRPPDRKLFPQVLKGKTW